jgi:hypothetical protein
LECGVVAADEGGDAQGDFAAAVEGVVISAQVVEQF